MSAAPASRYAILLRGVNVGGITVKMTELRAVLEDLGLDDVRTLLATGNAVVTSGWDSAEIKARVEQALRAGIRLRGLGHCAVHAAGGRACRCRSVYRR